MKEKNHLQRKVMMPPRRMDIEVKEKEIGDTIEAEREVIDLRLLVHRIMEEMVIQMNLK